MGGDDFAFRVDDGGIGGARAGSRDKQRSGGTRRGQRAGMAASASSAADLHVDDESFCFPISRAIIAICRRSDFTIEGVPTACSRELPGQTARPFAGTEGVNGRRSRIRITKQTCGYFSHSHNMQYNIPQ